MSRQPLNHNFRREEQIAKYLAYGCGLVLFLLPFHAFFTTLLGSNFGHLDMFRIWKEVVITAFVPFGVYLGWHSHLYKQWLGRSWLARLIIIYFGLSLALGGLALATHKVTAPAVIYGLMSNLRYLGFFLMVILVATRSNWLNRYWKHLVLLPAAVVVVFGFLQRTLLPYDFLKHFGYGSGSIPAYQTVDNKIDYRRIQSTLRGANPLGAYLVVVVGLLVSQISSARNRLDKGQKWFEKRWNEISFSSKKGPKTNTSILRNVGVVPQKYNYLIAGALTLVVLFFSYSRSAYVGVVITVGIVGYLCIKSSRMRNWLTVLAVAIVIMSASAIGLLRQNNLVENTFFHTDNTSRAATSSNADRAKALESGLADVVRHPLGSSPGTAGPASARNNHQARIAENYFIQIGQEVGWLGLGLFIVINVLVGWQLWLRRHEPLALALFASLIGLTFVNLLSHAWADDTLGLLWWGLAAIALAPSLSESGILKSKHNHQGN